MSLSIMDINIMLAFQHWGITNRLKPQHKKRKKYNQTASVRRLARERIGTVPASRVIVPKIRRKPKHKKQEEENQI